MRRPRRRRTGLLDNKSGSFGFDNWNLEHREKFEALLDDMIQEGLAIATEEYKCDAYLMGEKINVTLPLGPYAEEGPTWSFSLAEMIEDQIDLMWRDGEVMDQDVREELTALKASLDELVARLDKALAREE